MAALLKKADSMPADTYAEIAAEFLSQGEVVLGDRCDEIDVVTISW